MLKEGPDRGCPQPQQVRLHYRLQNFKHRLASGAAAAEDSRGPVPAYDLEENAMKRTASDWKIECKPSFIQGMGLFAVDAIPSGERVIEYVGEKIGSEKMLRRCAAGNPFIFALQNGEYMDGSVNYNLARFINHSCEPNCEMRWEQDCLWIVALRNIAAREEITFNYAYDLEDYRDYPCHCGSRRCVGYIVAEQFFDHVRAQNELRNANA